MSKKINLEELAQVGEEKKSDTVVKNADTKNDPQKEMDKLFELPFEVAMQNLKLNKDFVIEIGRQLLSTGTIEYKIELPMDNYMILTSKKASDELDYYTFLVQSIGENVTEQEFNMLFRVRNLASIIKEIKFGDYQESFVDKDIEYKYEKILSLPNITVNMLVLQSTAFQSALLLMMHPKVVDFLTKTLQK